MKRLFKWIFKSQLAELDKLNDDARKQIRFNKEALRLNIEKAKEIDNILGGISVSADVHENSYSRSWAVISIQGGKQDYIKFVDLGTGEIQEIARFMSRFDKGRRTVDASPRASNFLKIQVD